ncbi:MAG: NAD-dependent epimerase/dehydratase family protein [Trueperaceae bacterium]|nr:MAG: NAD-dependent epimerase/dehydratase family protein [Trueperaceae bacterium]
MKVTTSPLNWLVTGGCGFIGTRLVGHLLADNQQVRVVDNVSVGTREDLAQAAGFVERLPLHVSGVVEGQLELIEGDVRDERLALEAAQGMDVIVHLAGNTGVQPSIEDPRLDCASNVIGTLNYLEAARNAGVKRFVFASSGGTVIGDCEPPIHEEMVARPKSPYGASKSACEGYLSAYHGTFGLETVALRFSNVYGPGSNHKNSVVAKFIRRAMRGQALEIYGDGNQSRDFLYIDDLLEAVSLAATVEGVGGEVFQIASNRETTVNELAAALLPVLAGYDLDAVQLQHASPLTGEIRRNYSDTSKALRKLGWKPEVSLYDGLTRTVEWFLSTSDWEDSLQTQTATRKQALEEAEMAL